MEKNKTKYVKLKKGSPNVNRMQMLFDRILPQIENNLSVKKNLKKVIDLLISQFKSPSLLVIGGYTVGKGMESILTHPSIKSIETDVTFGERTQMILDSHDIPFEDNSFDCVIVQQVLEHVVDPHRCVEEIHRVLNQDGYVYAETPFMAQVHWGRYDFTRFTHLGHRRLFRKFKEIKSGATGGPEMVFAWAYMYFLFSFTDSKLLRMPIRAFARLTSFFFKYFDYYLVKKRGVFDNALGYYFLGQKSSNVLPDRELLRSFRGVNNSDL